MIQFNPLLISALSGFLAVAFGAFGSHALKERLSPYHLSVWDTANQYHFYNTFTLLALALLITKYPHINWLTRASGALIVGMILFSGSLYALALTDIKILGAITPIGGVCILIAWAMLAISAVHIHSHI
ncbi:MAG: DUF423 domain-containing protein [Pseudomonadota bacterium]